MTQDFKNEKPIATLVIYPYPEHIHNDLQDLISSINTFGVVLTREGYKFDGMIFQTSEELNEKLRDIPENDAVFDELWKSVPPYFMRKSIRRVDETGSYFVVLGDRDSQEAKDDIKNGKFHF